MSRTIVPPALDYVPEYMDVYNAWKDSMDTLYDAGQTWYTDMKSCIDGYKADVSAVGAGIEGYKTDFNNIVGGWVTSVGDWLGEVRRWLDKWTTLAIGINGAWINVLIIQQWEMWLQGLEAWYVDVENWFNAVNSVLTQLIVVWNNAAAQNNVVIDAFMSSMKAYLDNWPSGV